MPLVSLFNSVSQKANKANVDKDAILMLAYARGDSVAFEKLYANYKDQLYRFFLRQCGNRAIADELYQELWLRVIKSRVSYRPQAKFSTWVYRIAHNILIDYFRKPEFQSEELEDFEPSLGEVSDPSVIISGQEKLQRYRTQLKALSNEQREVFLLKEEGGLSLGDIALTTGENFETIKSRLRYAVNKLKQALIDDE